MTVTIFNTKTIRKEPLIPTQEGHVRLYVCGITAYDYCHIGHARSALVFDMIFRYLSDQGLRVTYVRNFTDIDDKIINRAREQQTSCEELSERFIQAFYEDMDRLGVARPTIEPRATGHVPEIIAMIQELMAKGLAYQAGGDVYYAVDKFAEYGRLGGRNLEELQAGARVEVNENKHNPLDFVLWKGSKPGEPIWESPWGPGRPGWHIECSAMSRKYLGDTFDIHGGGKDLVFPHHENEVAQSEGATGKTFVNTWIHHGFVTIKDEKMSKSLGNFLTIREVLSCYHPEVLRLFVYSTHYRNPLDYSDEAMHHAAAGLERLYDCAYQIDILPTPTEIKATSTIEAEERARITALPGLFQSAMDDDFNSARAMGYVFDSVKALNRLRQGLPGQPASEDVVFLRDGMATIRRLMGVLGLLKEAPLDYFRATEDISLRACGLDRQQVEDLIRQRNEARANREWARADTIRDQLKCMHIELLDNPSGTSWKMKPQQASSGR